ncbi:MAG TPA: flagellar filament capping protein FliD [Deltaproteobacteria bacterium]|nr:flagellar filament capping protein FliD [Deltaproteobacteria bacterium]
MASGLDWQTMINQLMQLERRPVTLLEGNKSDLSDRYDAWSDVISKLSTLKSSASALSSADDFNLFSASGSVTGSDADVKDLLKYAVGSTASEGTYNITVNNLATAQKIASKSFSSTTTDLGLTGDLIINGRSVSISDSDSLSDIQYKINSLNSGEHPAGVTASIISVSRGEYRLSLTSKATGADGLSIANGSGDDILSQLGLADETLSLRNGIAGGARSWNLSSSSESVGGLLGLSNAASGTVTVNGIDVSIDLSEDSLEEIADRLTLAGIRASVVTSEEDDETVYTLQIEGVAGAESFDDPDNVLQALGVLKQGFSAVTGVTGSGKNTADGTTITGDTLLADIDGYATWTPGDTISIGGADHSGNPVSATFTIEADSTVDDLLAAIEAAYGGNGEVSAYLNGDGAIVVEDNTSTLPSSLALTLSANIQDAGSSLAFGSFTLSTVRNREIVAGEDALITLDGVSITRSTNKISDVIAGVTLDLVGADEDATVTLNITRDTGGVKKLIQDFVNSYNSIMTYIEEQQTATVSDDKEKAKTNPLFADSSLRTIKSTLRSTIMSAVSGIDSTLTHLSLIGISVDKKGQLTIDNDKLDGYLETNFQDVMNLFTAQGTSTSSDLTYVFSNNDLDEGDYEVEITQAAEKATVTGTGFGGGSLDADLTLTITDEAGRVANISLSAGWGITSIVNAINSELSRDFQEIRVGENRYYSSSGADPDFIDANTTWASVYDSNGMNAGLEDGSTIMFSGTNRAGKAVSGSYTITDADTDNVGGLLSAIESKFGTGYDAYIDPEGRIAIKDTVTGDSKLTLTINATANLDFGAIDVDPSGADGSREGRYRMSITAEKVGGELKLSTDAYGDFGFTVAVSGADPNPFGITETTYTGKDAAGRIRKSGSEDWMTMTGDGQTLTVDGDQAAKGLTLRYTGTGGDPLSPVTLDFSFMKGVGAKLDRAIHYMTDNLDGYIVDKQKSLKNQMDSIDKKIDRMEVRFTKYQESLIAKFTLMEKLLSQMQSQQSALSGLLSNYNS